jgi:hypothetical protein
VKAEFEDTDRMVIIKMKESEALAIERVINQVYVKDVKNLFESYKQEKTFGHFHDVLCDLLYKDE